MFIIFVAVCECDDITGYFVGHVSFGDFDQSGAEFITTCHQVCKHTT